MDNLIGGFMDTFTLTPGMVVIMLLGTVITVISFTWVMNQIQARVLRQTAPGHQFRHAAKTDLVMLNRLQEHVRILLPVIPKPWHRIAADIHDLAFVRLPVLYEDNHRLRQAICTSQAPEAHVEAQKQLLLQNRRQIDLCRFFLENLDGHLRLALRKNSSEDLFIHIQVIYENLGATAP
jgi:hypothetical protein